MEVFFKRKRGNLYSMFRPRTLRYSVQSRHGSCLLLFFDRQKARSGLLLEMRTTVKEAVESMQLLNQDILEDGQSLSRALHVSMVCVLSLLLLSLLLLLPLIPLISFV